ncbi:MAG: transcriptional activator NhaR [Magnetococcales bacterium]|nr:transcriptional activator NhaR [Magnetococcales bacterium]MBF0322946.1 transcriptional activator NhaR [Magnetococcales bacterium]
MNYKHLHYFWKVAQAGSITKACKLLHLRPQTLSTQIQALEEVLGLQLFARIGRRLELTDAGRVAFDYANDMFLLGNELEESLKGMPTKRPIRFHVGVAEVVPKLIAYRLLEPALHCEREVQLTCHEGRLENLLADLALHKLDMVLADGPIRSHSPIRLFHHPLGASGLTFFGTSALVERYPGLFPARLDHAPLLLPTNTNAIRGEIIHWLDGLNITPKIVAEFQDSALMKAFGQAGVGFFCSPSIIEDDIVLQHRVEIIGHTHKVLADYFAITVERQVNHPATLAIQTGYRQDKP